MHPALDGIDPTGRDEGLEVGAGEADVAADLREADAAFGDEPAHEPGGCAESRRGLRDGQERVRWAASVNGAQGVLCAGEVPEPRGRRKES